MKLLLDQNLSHSLLEVLKEGFPGSAHVRDLGLEASTDRNIWEFAQENGFALVSKDSDFRQMSFLFGAPPKVVWIRIGNCTTSDLAELIRSRAGRIKSFLEEAEATFLILE